MTSLSRIGLRFVQGLALSIALVSGLAILTSTLIMYKYDIRLLGVQTGSMEPAIKVGDGLISHPVELNELTAGEIVNYQTDSGATISHRIVKVDSQKQHLITIIRSRTV
jgi:signal peptidase I